MEWDVFASRRLYPFRTSAPVLFNFVLHSIVLQYPPALHPHGTSNADVRSFTLLSLSGSLSALIAAITDFLLQDDGMRIRVRPFLIPVVDRPPPFILRVA